MKITLSKNASCGGKINIPAGEYMVSLSNGNSEIVLTGGGKQFKLPAVKRRQAAKSKTTNVMFYCGGGPLWSIVLSTPKLGEWVSMIEYENTGPANATKK